MNTENQENIEEKNHEKFYVYCENMCREEGLSKKQIEAKLKGKILHGTEIPSNNLGQNEDIYIQFFD